jgi:hypothetical protein
MSARAEAFEHWIRTSFVHMNTELENLYFAQENREQVIGCGEPLKASLRDEGHAFVVALLAEGNTGEGFDSAFGVLGTVGMYLGALRRHELTNPAREERSPFREASSLALHVGASLGMAPRFSTGHLATYNKARAGVRRSFTSLPDEFLFIDENTRGIFSLQRAADALTSIVHLGVSSPVADIMFDTAKQALRDVIRFNDRLMAQLDVERFFYSVRPYYKPYRVGRQEYRGANAGDFSGINEIDLLLGLCRANDPYYAQLLVDKMLFMLPADQARLRDCMTRTSLLDELLVLAEEHGDADWFQQMPGPILGVRPLRAVRGAASRRSGPALYRGTRRAPECTRPGRDHGQRASVARCWCARLRFCETCGWPRTARTSVRGTGIWPGCARLLRGCSCRLGQLLAKVLRRGWRPSPQPDRTWTLHAAPRITAPPCR